MSVERERINHELAVDGLVCRYAATDDGLTETFEGKFPSLLELQQFRVMNNVAYFGGYYRNRPVVMRYSFFDQTTMRALLAATPLPPLPAGFTDNYLGVHFGFEYQQ